MPITFEEVTASIEPERRAEGTDGGARAVPTGPAAAGAANPEELAGRIDQHLRLAAERLARLCDD